LYGMTQGGGNTGLGVLISFNPATNRDSVLWNFGGNGNNCENPYCNLVYNANDSLYYGTTYDGTQTLGTIITFNPTNNNVSVVWNFGKGADGKYPHGNLVYDARNKLFYGTTSGGGFQGVGTIFAFNPVKDTEAVVWNFNVVPNDGFQPFGSLVYYPDNGLYYGMAVQGGTKGLGVIYSFDPSSNSESVVWNFTGNPDGSDGSNPRGNFVLYSPVIASADKSKRPVSSINVYPNPNSGLFTIQMDNGQWTVGAQYIAPKIEIYDVWGSATLPLNPQAGALRQGAFHIDMSGYPEGIYFYRVMQEDGSLIGVGKVIIAK
jgi:uncharacterized repeat protein (TIGR03803 family)